MRASNYPPLKTNKQTNKQMIMFTYMAGRCRSYNRRMNAVIPKPARTAACTEVVCVLELCMCALVVSPKTTSEQH